MIYKNFKVLVDILSKGTPNSFLPKLLTYMNINEDTGAELYLMARLILAILAAFFISGYEVLAWLFLFIQISSFVYLSRIIFPVDQNPLQDPERSLFFAFGHYLELGFTMAYVYYVFGCFDDCISKTDTIYFSFVTMSTLGYGDILPSDDITKLLVVSHLIASLFLFAVVIGLFLSLASSKKSHL